MDGWMDFLVFLPLRQKTKILIQIHPMLFSISPIQNPKGGNQKRYLVLAQEELSYTHNVVVPWSCSSSSSSSCSSVVFLKLIPFLKSSYSQKSWQEDCWEFGFLCRQGKKERKERKGKEGKGKGDWKELTTDLLFFGFVGCFLSIMAKVQNDFFFFFFFIH